MHLTQKVYINNLIIHECLASNDIRHNYVEQNIRIFLYRNMSVVKVVSRLWPLIYLEIAVDFQCVPIRYM